MSSARIYNYQLAIHFRLSVLYFAFAERLIGAVYCAVARRSRRRAVCLRVSYAARAYSRLPWSDSRH